MKSRAYCFTLLLAIVISNTANLPAQAQRARVFVSVAGNDSNPCTAGSPCKTFQHAHDVVLAGGEISVLDTGGYGILTITKAVSIVAVGVQASIATTSGNTGIIINAGSTDNVSLRGLTLDGAGGGENGILFNTGLSLTVEDCVVRNMTQFGLFLAPTVASSLGVSNSHFDDNGSVGILIQTESANAVTIECDPRCDLVRCVTQRGVVQFRPFLLSHSVLEWHTAADSHRMRTADTRSVAWSPRAWP